MLTPFWLAVQFLTRLPTPAVAEASPAAVGRSALAYPLVGLLIGLFVLLPMWLFPTGDPRLVAALSLIVWVLTTGALHLDGLADSADAWLGGQGDAERSLEIMKDPRSGPAAVVLVVLVMLAKFVALAVLAEHGEWLAVLLMPAAARAGVIALFLTTPYVRRGGLGETLAREVSGRTAVWVTAATLLVMLAGGGAGAQALVCGVLAFLGLRALMVDRLGGTTGDTAGALIELTETVMLLAWALALE